MNDRLTAADVRPIYEGSNGELTTRLYRQLEEMGPVGVIAVNLFRASKTSERAKLYRGGRGFKVRNRRGNGFAREAYARKDWSIGNLCKALVEHDAAINMVFGWGFDAKSIGFEHVLYLDLPTGQVSFHTSARGGGPDYPREWDSSGKSAERIIAWVESILAKEMADA